MLSFILTTSLLISWSLSLSFSCNLAMMCRSSTLLLPVSSLSFSLHLYIYIHKQLFFYYYYGHTIAIVYIVFVKMYRNCALLKNIIRIVHSLFRRPQCGHVAVFGLSWNQTLFPFSLHFSWSLFQPVFHHSCPLPHSKICLHLHSPSRN